MLPSKMKLYKQVTYMIKIHPVTRAVIYKLEWNRHSIIINLSK